MSKKRLVISLYLLAVCLLGLKICYGEMSNSAKGISMTTGYINSDGQFVTLDRGYYGQDSQKMENFLTLANISGILGVFCLVLGTACLIFMHGDKRARRHSEEVKWVYDDTPKDE